MVGGFQSTVECGKNAAGSTATQILNETDMLALVNSNMAAVARSAFFVRRALANSDM